MFDFIKGQLDRRYINDGRVQCPIRMSELDADLCVDCCWLRGMHRAEREPFVRCRPGFMAEEGAHPSRQP